MSHDAVAAITAAVPHSGDGAVGKAAHFRPRFRCQVHTIVEPLFPFCGMLSVAKIRAEGPRHWSAVVKTQKSLFHTDPLGEVLLGIKHIG